MAEDSPKCWAVSTIKGFGKVKNVCIYCALLTILLLEDLAIRAGGPSIEVLTLHHVCPCCEEPFGVDFVEIGSFIN